jgi:glucose/arabinose dehydrogenase
MAYRNPISRPLRMIIALSVIVLAIAACGGDDDAKTSDNVGEAPIETPGTADQGDVPLTPDAEVDEPDAQDDTVDGTDTASSSLSELNLELELFVDGLIQPTDMVPATDETDRLFVTSRPGTIHVIEGGELRDEPLLDIRDQVEHHMVEQGLLSMALHPEFADNGYLYVYYITYGDEDTMVSRFELSDDGEHALRETETPILEVEQPHYSHNGGSIKFGPDGYLYIGLGDGEDPGDPHEVSQDPNTLLGSILRIDVDGGEPYAIPADNPFVGNDDGLDEVWAYGLRNPWRFSFDDRTGDMYMVDVGQWEVEEVNVQRADSSGGENYGWPIMEGDQCWEAEECDKDGLTMPVATYPNPAMGCAIIGGFTYHGEAFPELEGIYFFGDWCSGRIWGLVYEDDEWQTQELIHSDLMINAFGRDHQGEIYALDFEEGGGIYRITSR